MVDPQRIASGRPGRPLTQHTMIAGGLTQVTSDAKNNADDSVMITVRSILIGDSQFGFSNKEVDITKGTK